MSSEFICFIKSRTFSLQQFFLFLSFRPPDFDSFVTHLQNALKRISSWMTANPLTLNSSKTESLLIGLQQRLAKIHNYSFTTTDSAWNLGFIFDSQSHFL